jgi:hypothetical protein
MLNIIGFDFSVTREAIFAVLKCVMREAIFVVLKCIGKIGIQFFMDKV